MKNFAPFDTQHDLQVAILLEIYLVLHFVLKSDNRSALYDFLEDLQTISEGSVYSLVAKTRVFYYYVSVKIV